MAHIEITRFTKTAEVTEHYWIRRKRNGEWEVVNEDGRIMATVKDPDIAIARCEKLEATRDERIAKAKAAREAEEAKKASAHRAADMVTDRQLAYIRDLIRSGAGDEGGFMVVPADKDLPSLTKREASALISSLKGDY